MIYIAVFGMGFFFGGLICVFAAIKVTEAHEHQKDMEDNLDFREDGNKEAPDLR